MKRFVFLFMLVALSGLLGCMAQEKPAKSTFLKGDLLPLGFYNHLGVAVERSVGHGLAVDVCGRGFFLPDGGNQNWGAALTGELRYYILFKYRKEMEIPSLGPYIMSYSSGGWTRLIASNGYRGGLVGGGGGLGIGMHWMKKRIGFDAGVGVGPYVVFDYGCDEECMFGFPFVPRARVQLSIRLGR